MTRPIPAHIASLAAYAGLALGGLSAMLLGSPWWLLAGLLAWLALMVDPHDFTH